MTEGSETLQSPRFLVDGMLGSLARKLRIIGFDTVYDIVSQDSQLLKEARESGRYLITSDIELFLSAKRLRISSILIHSRSEREQLFETLSGTGINSLDLNRIPRCSECNGILRASAKSISGKQVYVCEVCHKEYWKGKHWKKLGPLFQEVNDMLMKSSIQDRK